MTPPHPALPLIVGAGVPRQAARPKAQVELMPGDEHAMGMGSLAGLPLPRVPSTLQSMQ